MMKSEDTSEYYRLKTQAIDDLIHADASNSPEVSREELRKYRSPSKLRLPPALKAVLIKYWFAAAICFFFMFGSFISDTLDLLFVLALGAGLITDLLTDNILRFVAEQPGANDKFIMYAGQRGFTALGLNVLHAGIVVYLTYCSYNIISLYAPEIYMGVEPLGFGLIYTALDLGIIGIKRLLCAIISDARKTVSK